jgi:hypothetical protein
VTMLTDLAVALSDALERETAALRQGDYGEAAQLAPGKLAALKAFTEAAAEPAVVSAPLLQAEAEPEGQPSLEADLPDPQQVFDRLRDAALANRTALEAALAVQGRVVEVVTNALRAQSGAPVGYGTAAPVPPVPFVLSVKA